MGQGRLPHHTRRVGPLDAPVLEAVTEPVCRCGYAKTPQRRAIAAGNGPGIGEADIRISGPSLHLGRAR